MLKKLFMVVLSIGLLAIPCQASAASSVATSVKSAETVSTQVNAKISVTTAAKVTNLDGNLVKKLKTTLDAASKKVKALKTSKTKTTYNSKLKKVTAIYKHALTYQKVYAQGTKVDALATQLDQTIQTSPSSSTVATLQTQLKKELSTFQAQLKNFYNSKTKAALTTKFQTNANSLLGNLNSDSLEVVEIK